MPRVCITIVYFGHWPVWFSAWLRTCRENRGFHWLIFTDNVPPADAPGHVRIRHLSQQQLASRVSSMLQLPV
ncbi:MAG: DUF6625 family protein, partial [Planctomyces sp.]